jgi:hypothetical protein
MKSVTQFPKIVKYDDLSKNHGLSILDMTKNFQIQIRNQLHRYFKKEVKQIYFVSFVSKEKKG